MNTNDDIRRIVDPGKPLPTFAEAMAMADAARTQLADLNKRMARLEATRAPQPAAAPPKPTVVTRAAAPAKPTIDDISRALAEMPADERALLLTRASLALPMAVPGLA